MKRLLCLLIATLLCVCCTSCVKRFPGMYDDEFGMFDEYDDYDDYDDDYNDYDDYYENGQNSQADSYTYPENNEVQTQAPVTPAQKTSPSKTILVYMVGSNLTQAAIWDIQEMIGANFDDKKNNIILYVGGASEWPVNTFSQWNNSTYRVQNNDIVEVARDTAKNMGTPKTLTDFIKYGISSYPAEQYGLILWDHGGGPFGIYGYDTNYEDGLYMNEIVSALKSAGIGTRNKFEFIGFDACLMASAETAWSLKDMANSIIFSQEVEPSCGWNYSFLSEIDNCYSAKDIGKAVVDTYIDGCDAFFYDYPQAATDITLSCLDLTKMNEFEYALDDLFKQADIMHTEDIYKEIVRCRRRAKVFGKYSTNYDYDMVDLVHLCNLMKVDYPDKAKKVIDVLDDMILYNQSDIINANGLSIYFPYSNKTELSSNLYSYDNFDFAPTYTKFIGDFAALITDESNNSWRGFDVRTLQSSSAGEGEDNIFSVQLTKEQMANYSDANMVILEKIDENSHTANFFDDYSGDKYRMVYKGTDFNLDANGLLSASLPENLLYIIDERFSVSDTLDVPLQLLQINDGSEKERYHIPTMFEYLKNDFEMIPAYWQVEIKDGKAVFQGAVPINNDNGTNYGEKMLLDYTQCSHLSFAPAVYLKTFDANGVESTPDNWKYLGASGYQVEPQYGFHAELRPITNKDNYVCYFIIEDLQGNTYTTNAVPLS